MVAVAPAFSIFSLQDETNLTRFVGVLAESKPPWHEGFGNTNTVELTPAKLGAETVHSVWSTHFILLQHYGQRREYQTEASCVLYVMEFMPKISSMRPKLITRIIRDLGAMTLGYAVIVLLTSIGFNGVLGGRPLYGGSPFDLAGGMMVAIISGLVGGCIAGLIGAERGIISAALVLVPLIGDTIYVLFFFKKSTAPFWFDALASATLMACTVLGGILREGISRPNKTIAA